MSFQGQKEKKIINKCWFVLI